MSFCKWYNKIMLQLNKNFTKTNKVNIIGGIIMILLSIILFFFDKISSVLFYPVNIISPYIPKGLPFKRKSSFDAKDSIVTFLVVIILVVGMWLTLQFHSWIVNPISMFITVIIVYITTVIIVTLTIIIFNESLANKIFKKLLADPIITINNKLSSKCNLKLDNKKE